MNAIDENSIVITINKIGSAPSEKLTWCHRGHVRIVRMHSCIPVCVVPSKSTRNRACSMITSLYRRISNNDPENRVDILNVRDHLVSKICQYCRGGLIVVNLSLCGLKFRIASSNSAPEQPKLRLTLRNICIQKRNWTLIPVWSYYHRQQC